jgi:N utilization substance protein B
MKTKHDPRHVARQLALMTLFEWSFHSDAPREIIEHVLDVLEEDQHVDLAQVEHLVNGVTEHLDELDARITTAAPEWPRDQIAKIDICILRISAYELQHSDVPEKVVIDEAVELAKEYGGDTSSKFINGVLGTLVRELDRGSSAQPVPAPQSQAA